MRRCRSLDAAHLEGFRRERASKTETNIAPTKATPTANAPGGHHEGAISDRVCQATRGEQFGTTQLEPATLGGCSSGDNKWPASLVK